MKLSRKQKIIRNTAIVIVLIAALPLLFDMHFSPDKAAHEALEKAGCEDADYIAQYTVKRGNNDKGSASVEKDMLSEDAYEQAKTADVLITEIYTIIAVQAVNIRQRSDAVCCLG